MDKRHNFTYYRCEEFFSYFIIEDNSKNIFNSLFFDVPDTLLSRTEAQMNNTDLASTGPHIPLESIKLLY